jgi:hypothetical protein
MFVAPSTNSDMSHRWPCHWKLVGILRLCGKCILAHRCPLYCCRVSSLCLLVHTDQEYEMIYRMIPGGLIGRLMSLGSSMSSIGSVISRDCANTQQSYQEEFCAVEEQRKV